MFVKSVGLCIGSRELDSTVIIVGLVSARAKGYYNIYVLETGALEKQAQRLLARETLPAMAAAVDVDAFDRQVLRHVIQYFEFDVQYPEK